MRKALWTTAAALALSLALTLSSALSVWFSGSISLPLAALISRATALVRWPVGEVLLVVGAPALILLLLWSAIRRKPPRGAALALSVVFLVYAVLWVPLCHVPAKEAEPYETWRLIKLSQTLGAQAETLRENADQTEEESSGQVLAEARNAVASLKLTNFPLSVPKFSQFPEILRTLRIAGVYAP
jgi:hypothetical protein